MRRDPRHVADEGEPFPLRATAIVLSVWVVGLVVLAFIVVPVLFATCGVVTSGGGP
jgi:hypothetical protein